MRICDNGIFRDATPEEVAIINEAMAMEPVAEMSETEMLRQKVQELEAAIDLLLSGATEG